jgi:DNA uptake protein ComE-like DNA-binding protein
MGDAAKSGSPQMTGFRPTIPASVPLAAQGTGAVGVTDVGAQIAADPNALANNPEARATAPAAEGQAAAAPAAAPATATAITRTGVDLNTATAEQLTKLPGINKLMAQRIMASRPFLSVNDLIRIGVSKKTIEKLKPAPAAGAAKSPTK